MMVTRVLEDTKVGVSTVVATTGTRVADLLNWIPDDIGKLGTLVGILLSVAIIITHAQKWYLRQRKHQAEMRKFRDSLVVYPGDEGHDGTTGAGRP